MCGPRAARSGVPDAQLSRNTRSAASTTPRARPRQPACTAIAHLDHEPGALRVTDVPVADNRLDRVVPASVAVFDRNEALITYAAPCIINGKRAPHLVMQGQYGPITIVLMPEENVGDVTPIEGESVHGQIIPVGDGSIAIIGPRDEPLEPVRQKVLNSVTWTT